MGDSTASRRLQFNPLRFSLPPPAVVEDRQSMIAKAAYFHALRRNFEPGHDVEDWLAAEKEVDQFLRLRKGSR